MNDPIGDEVRSILDGHIVLTRELAEENHFPAIDIGLSASPCLCITLLNRNIYVQRLNAKSLLQPIRILNCLFVLVSTDGARS